VACCAIRETFEETGVGINPADLVFTHVVHHRNPEGQGRVGFFFTAARWAGEPVNREPHKCAGLYWVDPASPPANTVPGSRPFPSTAGDLAGPEAPRSSRMPDAPKGLPESPARGSR
jgi:ADP-ribose pyrophosphatase YjhB (NUDIX family)